MYDSVDWKTVKIFKDMKLNLNFILVDGFFVEKIQ